MMKIGIIGCGWLGLHIAKYLSSSNRIYTTTTSQKKKTELAAMGYDSIAIQFSDDKIFQNLESWKVLNMLDVIIITVPFSKRSDISILKNRFENLSLFIKDFNKQLFLMSSIGIYPQLPMEISENTLNEKDLNSSVLFIENFIKNKFPQVNILRLGGLMGGSRVFSNYKISDPNKMVNHIHHEDICNIIKTMINKNMVSKMYNVVAPLHPSKQEVINFQKGIKGKVETIENSRKIVSDLLIKDLKYDFSHPNPIAFE